jgi:hypothetical protein
MLGEEFIPEFTPVALPSYLQIARNILFGATPDKVFLNFRAYELLSLLHSTELEEFVLAADQRITYSTTGSSDFFVPKNSVVLERTGGSEYANLNLDGAVKPDNAAGRAYLEYNVRLFSDTDTTAIIQFIPVVDGETSTAVVAWSVPSARLPMRSNRTVMRQMATNLGLSRKVQVPNTGLNFQLTLGRAEPNLLAGERAELFETEPVIEPKNIELDGTQLAPTMALNALRISEQQLLAEWSLTIYVKPSSAISVCLPKLEFLGEPFYLELFGTEAAPEPYATFRNIWFSHPLPAYRLSAFVLAMIYRTDEARAQNV